MRFYTGQHQYYCGIDLHTKNMYVCILDQAGQILVHKNIQTLPHALMRILEPFQPDVAVTVECIFTWYWIADLCMKYNISRFERVQNFTSYARLIKPLKESFGKVKSGGKRKLGNAYLKWAFSEANLLLIREKQEIKDLHLTLKNKHGKARALAIISHKLGRAVYYMLKNKSRFIGKPYV